MENKKKAIILLGPSAVGKGFISQFILPFGFKYLLMSNLLKERIDRDQQFKSDFLNTMNGGLLLNDQYVIDTLGAVLNTESKSNLVLDGCTRSIEQLNFVLDFLLENQYSIIVIKLDASESVCLERMGIRKSEAITNGLEPRKDDLHENSQKTKLRLYFSSIDDILGIISDRKINISNINAEIPKAKVVLELFSLLISIDFI